MCAASLKGTSNSNEAQTNPVGRGISGWLLCNQLLQGYRISALATQVDPPVVCIACRYGPEQGYGSFRTCLADFLKAETGHTVDADELLVTAGKQRESDVHETHHSNPILSKLESLYAGVGSTKTA